MDYKKYLKRSNYEWKDLFIFCIDENKGLRDVITGMVDCGYLDKTSEENIDELINYLENKLTNV